MSGRVGHLAQDGDGRAAAFPTRRSSDLAPGGGAFVGLGPGADNARRGGIDHIDRLAANVAVAAGIAGRPEMGRADVVTAVTPRVSKPSSDGDGSAAASIVRSRQVKAPRG